MQDWLASLSSRERYMVLACGAFVVLALVWALGVQPLIKQSSGLEERVDNKRAQLALMHERAAQVQPGSAGASGGNSGDSLVVIIDRTTREKDLAGYLKRNQPEGAQSVRLRFEGAPFDDLVSWLGELSDRYRMTTVNATVDQAGIGRVNASLVIQRAGG